MTELPWIKENLVNLPEIFHRRGIPQNGENKVISDELDRLKSLQSEIQSISEESNRLAKLPDPGKIRKQGKKLKARKTSLKRELDACISELQPIIRSIPNRLNPTVPEGSGEKDNLVIHTHGEKPHFDFDPLTHDELGLKLGIFDFARGVKVAGTRFAALIGKGAKLERALMNFCLDYHTQEKGFTEVFAPTIINSTALYGTGQLPKFEEDLFKIQGENMYMSPTAEVPITNLHAGEILNKELLPLRYCSYSSCYRSEAGSAGRDVKGYLRQRQFQKVEMVVIAKPEESYAEHEAMTAQAEGILEKLGLPYRRVLLCGGDTGFAAAKCYDLEVWLPGQRCYREISSCSNCEDFQARRMNLRYRRKDGIIDFVHTLNGSGLALGRLLIAILENHQNANGQVQIPLELQKYFGSGKI